MTLDLSIPPSRESADFLHWASMVWMEARAHGEQPLDREVAIAVTLRPARSRYGCAPLQSDLDDALAATVEALRGVCYCKDAQVVQTNVEAGAPTRRGGLRVTVSWLTGKRD